MQGKDATFKFLEQIERLIIPYFQRRYVWEESNWEQLLQEWEYGNVDHFLGSIVLNNPQISSTEGKVVEVIDGQQRLTTLTILYKVCFDIIIEKRKGNPEVIGEEKGKKKLVLGKDGLKLVHSKLDIDDYKMVMSDEIKSKLGEITLTSEAEKLNYKKKKKNRVNASSNILQCYKYFYNNLKSNDYSDKIEYLWEDLNSSSKKLFVVIDIYPNENAQQIFDCINSAGVRLTSADIVKNNLFSKAKTILKDNDKLDIAYKNYWDDVFEKNNDTKNYWDSIISIGRYKRDNLEMLLYCYAMIKGIYDPDKHTIDKLSKLYKDKIDSFSNSDFNELEDFIKGLKEYAEVYRKYIDFNSDDEYSYDDKLKLFMLSIGVLDTTTFCAYILKVLKENIIKENSLPKELDLLQKLIYRAAICNDTSTMKNYNKECANLVSCKKTIDKYYDERMNEGLITNQCVVEALHHVSSNKIAKIVLFLTELKMRNQKRKTENELKYIYQTEHIMPVTYANHWGFDKVPVKKKIFNEKSKKESWTIESDLESQIELRENAILEIGNMTLLTSSLNQSYGNQGMEKKSSKLKSYASNIIITTDVLSEYEQSKIWDEETISKRTDKIINEFMSYIE